MANVDRPRGLWPLRDPSGEIRVNAVRGKPYLIDSNTAGAIARGDQVALEAGGNIELGAAGNDLTACGVFAGCRYTDANGDVQYSDYIPAAKTGFTNMEADVWDNPNTIFGIQSVTGTTPAATDVGALADISAGTSDSTRKLSAHELNVGTGAQYKILGLVTTPNNVYGEHADLEVMFNEHLYKAAVAGV